MRLVFDLETTSTADQRQRQSAADPAAEAGRRVALVYPTAAGASLPCNGIHISRITPVGRDEIWRISV